MHQGTDQVIAHISRRVSNIPAHRTSMKLNSFLHSDVESVIDRVVVRNIAKENSKHHDNHATIMCGAKVGCKN